MGRVLNLSNGETDGFYIGRKTKKYEQSSLANPFLLEKEGDRDRVIKAYRLWLWYKICNKSIHLRLQKEYNLKIASGWLNPKSETVRGCLLYIAENDCNVICFCAPKPCHGDVVLRASKWLLTRSCS